MKRLLISGTNSNCGKTTITCAILSALSTRGIIPTTFKCGPDYIDPMFHRAVSGITAYNIDPFFLDGKGLRSHLSTYAGSMVIMEGAMGFYDGIAETEEASAYTVAHETKTPVIIVVNAKGAGASLSAVIEGFTNHRPNNYINGVIFNNADAKRYEDLCKIALSVGVKAYGYMPHKEDWTIPSRHLGMLTTNEISNIKNILISLGQQAEKTLDIDGLLSMAETAPFIEMPAKNTIKKNRGVRLAVAKDEAFCFMYEENLMLLERLGCELVFFSPLHDCDLPPNINGLYLCGGYPELYTKRLSENKTMLKSIKNAIGRGLPTIAEGGGFIYLHDYLDDIPMCGVINGLAFETKHLQRFGYVNLIAEKDNLLCKAGEIIRSREFHYWDSSNGGSGFIARKAGRDISYSCIHATDTIYAGFPHLFFPASPSCAKRFIERMTGL